MIDPALFGAVFNKPSWSAWRTVAKVLDGMPLDTVEAAFMERISGRSATSWAVAQVIREGYFAIARRGGKSYFTAGVAVHAGALMDYSDVLAPGQRAVISIIASTTDQAGVLFGYCSGLARGSPIIASEIVRETSDSIEFANGNVIEVHANSFRSIRGRSFALMLLDELAFYRDEGSALPDVELRRAALPGLLPGGRILGISSPWARRGLLYAMHSRHYGKDGSPVLVLQADTLTMNPVYDVEKIAALEAEDMVAARTEFGGQFREDLQQFLDDATIERAVATGVSERPPLAQLNGGAVQYVGFADMSGGKHDAAALGIAHREAERLVLDCVRVVPAPHSPQEAIAGFAKVLKQYRIAGIKADGYAGNFTPDEFAKHGITCTQSELPRSGIYLALLPNFTTGRIDLLDHTRLIHELRGLERSVRAGGRESVDHGRDGHDDVINAAGGALWLLSRQAASTEQTVYVQRSTLWDSYGDHGIEQPFLSIFERTPRY